MLNRVTERSDNAGFAAAVAEFGMLLRHSEHRGDATYREAAALARRHRGRDESGYRAEFIRLIELAEALTRQTRRDWQASAGFMERAQAEIIPDRCLAPSSASF